VPARLVVHRAKLLHEDMVARFTLLDEGLNGRSRRSGRARKKKPH
jgi:hypothetical protein